MTKIIDDNFIPSEKNKFIHYRSFLNTEEGEKIEALLEKNQIPHQFDIPRESLSSSIIGEKMPVKAILKILAQDFNRVDKLLAKEIKKISVADLKEHPLQEHSDDDLYEILIKPDEWNIENLTIAQMILSSRGHDISVEEIERLRSERISKIREGKDGSIFLIITIVLALVTSLLSSRILPFLLGMAVGAYYGYAKNYDLNGDAYYEYTKQTRNFGKTILIGSFLLLLAKGVFLFYN